MTRKRTGASFMTRLARDIRGNTIALAAAVMIPLAGLIGGGVDMSRLYLVKTRLQQACDAGALAGRKAMGAGSWTTSGTGNSQSRANELFDANFKGGSYGTGTLVRNYVESSGTVTGTATAPVPMTIMKVFGMTQRTLTVNCTAKMEIPNTDVMFVLDVTGSMNCAPGTNCYANSPVTNAKITGLKSAVKCFYEALLKVNTSEVCGGDPTATTYTQTAQIRIGFMPYSVNVNVGKLLPNDFLANNWTYQSREPHYSLQPVVVGYTDGTDVTVSNPPSFSGGSWGSWSNWQTYTSVNNSNACNALVPASTYTGNGSEGAPYGQGSYTSGNNRITYWYTDQPVIQYGYQVGSYNSGKKTCVIQRRQRNTTATRTYSRTDPPVYEQQNVLDGWTYKAKTFDVSGLKAGGSTWNNSVSLPTGWGGAATSTSWGGCIEERQTVKNSDGDPSDEWGTIPSDAYDMNIDMIPNPNDPTTQWGPMLQNAVWGRYTGGNNTVADVVTSSDLSRNFSYYCTTEAKKLQTWYTPSSFVSYVNSLSAQGNTYHDIGMVWGARFISPTGIFASENAATATGGAIQRHIVFMTDGDTNVDYDDLSAYGIHWWDRRQTTYAPSDTNLDNILNARLTALCTAIKNKNITLWVVSYGGGVNATTEARLTACASPGKFFSAADTATLISNFKQIASEIAELRLTS